MARRGGVGSFAEGLLTGFTVGTKNRREEEEHQLRMAKARDEQAMNAEFKQLDTEVKPAQGYVLETPDGNKTVFADEKMAQEAQAAFGGDARVTPRFIVGGQQYDTEEAAQVAADAANAPAAKLRKRADIALKYNRPDLADAYTKNYNNMLEANRRDMQESFLQAQQMGDYGAVLDAYNQRLPNGAHAEMVPNEQGGMTLQITKNGQVVTQRPFATPGEFWDTMAQQVAQTPDNMLETWKTREGLKLQSRQVAATERNVDANVRKTEAEIAQMPAELDIKRQNARSSATSAGASAMNAQTARLGLMRPDVISGVDPKGNVVISATQRTPNKEGGWDLNVLPTQTIQGMAPTRTAGASGGLDALLLGGMGASQPLVVDWSKVPPKNIGGAAPAAPTATARPGLGGTGAARPATGLQAPGVPAGYTAEEWQRRQQLLNEIPR